MKWKSIVFLFIVLIYCNCFADGPLSDERLKRAQIANEFQLFVPFQEYWYQEQYRHYFAKVEKRVNLTINESRFIGKWLEWERVSNIDSPRKLTAANGSRLWFLPDKTFLSVYDEYPGTMKVYYLIGQWKIVDLNLYIKNVLVAYSSDMEIRYEDDINKRGIGSNVLTRHFSDDWYLFYSDTENVDWEYGYSYEGFKPIHMPKEIVGPYYDKLRPDSIRALDYSGETDRSSFPLISIYENIQKILAGDEAAIKEFARVERQVIPK